MKHLIEIKDLSVKEIEELIKVAKSIMLNPEDYLVKMFGRIGWICEKCENFNYENRKKCNRCGIQKRPKRIFNEDAEKRKGNKHKEDWVCKYCANVNYPFRIVCNRCGKGKE